MAIDLSQFLDKKVRVTFRNGNFDSGIVSTTTTNPMFPYVYTGRSLKEYYNIDGLKSYKEHLHAWDIIHIEEIKTVTKTVDLSKYLYKEVMVTRRNGETRKGKVVKNTLDNCVTHPYYIWGSYTTDGMWSYNYQQDTSGFDIVKVEEIQVKKYQELEKKVAEMQKEIERLKKEETKVPEINEIEVTRTIIYAPDAYLQYCEESGVIPTQDGFIDYVADDFDNDFANEYYGHQDIKELK